MEIVPGNEKSWRDARFPIFVGCLIRAKALDELTADVMDVKRTRLAAALTDLAEIAEPEGTDSSAESFRPASRSPLQLALRKLAAHIIRALIIVIAVRTHRFHCRQHPASLSTTQCHRKPNRKRMATYAKPHNRLSPADGNKPYPRYTTASPTRWHHQR